MAYYGTTFQEAIQELISGSCITHFELSNVNKMPPKSTSFDFNSIELDSNLSDVIEYLTKYRGININIVNDLIAKELIFKQRGTDNIVFAIYDEFKNVVGMELHGTNKYTRFKGLGKNSKYGYVFNIIMVLLNMQYFLKALLIY